MSSKKKVAKQKAAPMKKVKPANGGTRASDSRKFITVYLSEDQLDQLTAYATARGMGVSTFMRATALEVAAAAGR